jgi:hypothetical protein
MITELKAGDLLIERAEPSLFGWLIRKIAGRAYQHVRVVEDDCRGACSTTVEAIWPRVCITHLDTAGTALDHYEVWRPMCADDVKRRALDLLDRAAGTPYGGLQLLSDLVFVRLGLALVDDPWGKTCSGLAAWAYKSAGYDLNPGQRDALKDAPWDLRQPARSSCVKGLAP